MKKLFSFVLILALALSLSVSAFAAGNITISNATIGEDYEAYKIFDATFNTAGDVSYTIDPTIMVEGTETPNPIFVKLFGADGKADNTYFNYEASTGVVTLKDGIKNDDLFEYLDTLVVDIDPTAEKLDVTAEVVTFEGLDNGYYVIKRNNVNTTAITVNTNAPDVEVIDKNQLPSKPEKEADKATANVGDPISWTIEFTSTNYDGDVKVESYTIKDTLNPTGWANINKDSIKVKVGGKDLTAADFTATKDADGNFTIFIPWVDAAGEFKYDATAKVEISYSGVVTNVAAANDQEPYVNNVELDWSCDTTPGDSDTTETTVLNLGLSKVDGSGTKLENAEFVLYTDAACTKPVKVSGDNGVYKVDPNSENTTVKTPAGGELVIMGLAEGTYYLKETKAPAGYNQLSDTITVVVDEETGYTYTIGGVTYEIFNSTEVENNKGVELPSTGGQGTMLMITIGTMMAIAFAVLLITQKKMSVYHD